MFLLKYSKFFLRFFKIFITTSFPPGPRLNVSGRADPHRLVSLRPSSAPLRAASDVPSLSRLQSRLPKERDGFQRGSGEGHKGSLVLLSLTGYTARQSPLSPYFAWPGRGASRQRECSLAHDQVRDSSFALLVPCLGGAPGALDCARVLKFCERFADGG